ncbi:aminopeptidase [Candidatus Woesearchaeota archaeon]|nr:aminopeptidase [Candidatus Woesearchaeota archaeon]
MREDLILRDEPRAKELASLVLDYSVNLNEEDRLLLQFDPKFSFYASMFEEEARRIGAKVRYDPLSFDPVYLWGLIDRNDKKKWEEDLERRIELALWCTSRVLIDCDSNPEYAKGIPNSKKRVAEYNELVIGPFKHALYRKGEKYSHIPLNKWNIVGFPYTRKAEEIGMTLDEYSDFVYSATINVDWQKLEEEMKIVKEVFDAGNDVQIIVPGQTDISLSLTGREGYVSGGEHNMPGGEVFYGPVENSINGEIFFQHSYMMDGIGRISKIRLEFVDGKVMSSEANINDEGLRSVLSIDEGAKKIGELGLACNYGIKKVTNEVLFDEKIGGTIHLALGDAHREYDLDNGGGLNESKIHWDLICDLRKLGNGFPGGEIRVDDVLVQKDGKWLI